MMRQDGHEEPFVPASPWIAQRPKLSILLLGPPVVIYFMNNVRSNRWTARHGVSLLATSRVGCLCVVAGNPALFEPECGGTYSLPTRFAGVARLPTLFSQNDSPPREVVQEFGYRIDARN